MRILAVCGMGVGSSLLLIMNAQKALRELGVKADVEQSDIGLARQKWPEELRLVEDLPRTASGKIRKVDLRAWLRGDPA